jgi:DNA modification methylase
VTTKKFLEAFGFSSLRDLPDLERLKAEGLLQGGQGDADLDLHPTVKPIALVADAIMDSTNLDDLILDPFLGSGTTLLAAERARRRCHGVELDPLYVDTVIARWERLTQQQARLASGQSFADVKNERSAK